jgi:hypothetical protein
MVSQLFFDWLCVVGDANAAATLTAAQLRTSEHPAADSEVPMNPGDVAELLHVSPHTVLGWIRTTQLKASNIATGMRPRYVIQRTDLDRFLASRQPELPMRRRRRAG